MTVKAKSHATFEIKDGNLVTTRTEEPSTVALRFGTGLLGAAASFALSRKFRGIPRLAFTIGAVLRVFFVGLGAGAVLLKYSEDILAKQAAKEAADDKV